MAAGREYVRVMRERYRRAAGRAAKGALLDELERVLGWHRKHAVRAMASTPARAPRVRRGRPHQYLACLSAIERVWETLDYCCAERLQPHLVRVARDLVRCDELEAPAEVLEELGRISRAYRKNDNAHVEQKNRQLVREVVGYARYEQPEDVRWLNGVYELLDVYANVVLPSQTLIQRTRDGAKLRKRYDTARTALERLQALDAIEPQRQAELAVLRRELNPLALQRELDARLQVRANPPAALAEAAD